MITVPVCTIIPGLKLPVPRSAAPMATMANCSAMAGMNHSRYSPVSVCMVASALSAAAYDDRNNIAIARKITPATIDSTCDWLNRWVARLCSFRPAACDTTVVVPTPSICEIASTTNERLALMPTAATASVPSRPTQ